MLAFAVVSAKLFVTNITATPWRRAWRFKSITTIRGMGGIVCFMTGLCFVVLLVAVGLCASCDPRQGSRNAFDDGDEAGTMGDANADRSGPADADGARPDTALITPIGKTTWIERASSRAWESVASSSDGTKLVVVAPRGYIHVSADSGATWTWNVLQENWASVASSSNGNKLVTGVYGGPIYRSEDSGLSWKAVGDSYGYWASFASSSDGMDLAAVEADRGHIHRSRDSGQT